MPPRLTEVEARAMGLERKHGGPLALPKPRKRRPTEKSQGEETFALHLKLDRIPKPEREYKFHQNRKWRFDFCWPLLKVAVEIDGGVHSNGRHNRGKGFEEDLIKLNEASLLGWTVLRFSTGQVKAGMAIETFKRLVLGRKNIAVEVS